MALLTILCYPDPKLHKVAKPVQAVDARIQALVADMLETMYEAKGIGLAATQVDVHVRLIVIDVSEERNQPLVLINPEITWTGPATHLNEEGCLSVPGIYDGVQRFDEIKVRALDRDELLESETAVHPRDMDGSHAAARDLEQDLVAAPRHTGGGSYAATVVV